MKIAVVEKFNPLLKAQQMADHKDKLEKLKREAEDLRKKEGEEYKSQSGGKGVKNIIMA